MSKTFCIIRDKVVVNRVVADDISNVNYAFRFDAVIEDVDQSVYIGMHTDGESFFWPTFEPEQEQ